MSKPILAVTGATGAQGGGLAHAVLADKDSPFAVRAITRKPDGDKARALAAAGAEVVAADMDDEDSLRHAFAGASAVFAVTNFWEHMNAERELAQAHNLARAAKHEEVGHVVWSTLEDWRKKVPLDDPRLPTLKERYKVPHFDAKGEADEYFRQLDLPTTFFKAAFYWDNFIYFGMGPRPGPDGKLTIVMPLGGSLLPGIAAADIGPCAYGVLKRRDDFLGKDVGVAGGILSGPDMAAAMARALGREVTFTDVPADVYRGFGFPGADDLGNMFEGQRLYNTEFCAARDVALSRELNPALQDFATWLGANAARIPLG
jgi:uncharacterized protein YbjT (DUF2867 family)